PSNSDSRRPQPGRARARAPGEDTVEEVAASKTDAPADLVDNRSKSPHATRNPTTKPAAAKRIGRSESPIMEAIRFHGRPNYG
ncbi:MAG: hypothetical protein WAM44_03595, partial [Chthoniobacterales bacterium]